MVVRIGASISRTSFLRNVAALPIVWGQSDRSLSPGEAADDYRPGEDEAIVIVAKNGHGTCRDFRLAFDEECLSFSEFPDGA